MEYTTYKLSDILKIGNGKDHSSLDDGEYPVLGSGGVMRYANQYLYDGESVLLPRKGTLNNIQYIKGKFWTVDTCYYTIINQEKVVPYYLYRMLRYLDLSGLDSGASIPSMTSKCYYGIKIKLPSISTQRRIASILSAYDNLIENNNKRIKILEQMAEDLYKEWFVRFRFPGHETTPLENGIPKGWEIKRVDELAKIKAGGDRPDICEDVITDKCKVPVYSNGIENEGLYGFTDVAEINKASVTISARGTIGYVCLRRVPFVPIVRLLSVTPNMSGISVYYLYYMLKNDAVIGNGTSQQQITVPMLGRKKILVPENSLIDSFTAKAENIWNEIDLLKKATANLIKQRDLFLPRLMSGKLAV